MAMLLMVHAGKRTIADRSLLQAKTELVRTLELTDLCLFTEASYTRHLALADLRTPFQEYPLAMEHFPSGSLTSPPPHLTESHAPHP
jgi:hypothetical protein